MTSHRLEDSEAFRSGELCLIAVERINDFDPQQRCDCYVENIERASTETRRAPARDLFRPVENGGRQRLHVQDALLQIGRYEGACSLGVMGGEFFANDAQR
jgi:hypothetical protein